MTSLLVTGGSGYLGAELVGQALGTRRVFATYTSNPQTVTGADFFPLDLRDPHAAVALIEQLRPELIIHTAYAQRGPDLLAITAEGAGHVARAAHSIGARLIHMSSDALFDGEADRPYTEADAPSPITPYGSAKAEAERLVATACPKALIVRTSLIYGGAEPSVHEQFILSALAGAHETAFFTDEIRNPIQVGDLASALLELAPTQTQGVLHIAGAEAISRYAFARKIAEWFKRDAHNLVSGLSRESGMRRPRYVALDSSRAQPMLATKLRGVSEVLATARTNAL